MNFRRFAKDLRSPETLGLVVSDADKDLNDDVEASVDETTW